MQAGEFIAIYHNRSDLILFGAPDVRMVVIVRAHIPHTKACAAAKEVQCSAAIYKRRIMQS